MSQQSMNTDTQLARVIAVMCDKRERTVSRIENEIWNRFGIGESRKIIAQCLDAVHLYGWGQQKRLERINGKEVWHYQLIPIEGHADVMAFN
jgi:hypothetical protein